MINYFEMSNTRGRSHGESIRVRMQDGTVRAFFWDVPNVPNGRKAGCWVDGAYAQIQAAKVVAESHAASANTPLNVDSPKCVKL